MELKQAKPEDWPEILDMARAFHAEDGHALSQRGEIALRNALHASSPFSPYAQVLTVKAGGTTAGYAVLCFSFSIEFGGMTSYLDDFYVKPEFRGQGIGTKALEEFEFMSRARGCCIFHLETEAANDKAKAFYIKHGLEDTGRRLLIKKL
ncbi:MAG: GNAT family N-acetyltransferase [Alphaproteobacteria bacterium]